MSTLTDAGRDYFKACGHTYADLNVASLRRLRIVINRHLKTSGLMNNSYRCFPRVKLREVPYGSHKLCGEIWCNSFYFQKREAVTFNPDGFIGFAGWADDENVKPIVGGFIEWCMDLKIAKRQQGTQCPLVIESWGSDRYMLVSRGHHDLELFKQKCREEHSSWMYNLDHPKHPAPCIHAWYVAADVVPEGYNDWFEPCNQDTPGSFPVTIWAE